MTSEIIAGEQSDFPPIVSESGAFVYAKHVVVPKTGSQLHVSFMEIPPGASAFPYHWHEGITEAYVILQGTGSVRTPDGEVELHPGSVIVFPPGPAGAHRIVNTSPTDVLRYVDLDTVGHPDVVHHVDSGKVGISAGTRSRRCISSRPPRRSTRASPTRTDRRARRARRGPAACARTPPHRPGRRVRATPA